jgi:hypothetical protein
MHSSSTPCVLSSLPVSYIFFCLGRFSESANFEVLFVCNIHNRFFVYGEMLAQRPKYVRKIFCSDVYLDRYFRDAQEPASSLQVECPVFSVKELCVMFHEDSFVGSGNTIVREKIARSPLWSSDQSSWLQIQRPGFNSRGYQTFWEVVSLERGSLSLVSTVEELLGSKSSVPGLESRGCSGKDVKGKNMA